MGSGVHTYYSFVYQPLFFVNSQKTALEERELSASNRLELLIRAKIFLEELSNILATKFRQN